MSAEQTRKSVIDAILEGERELANSLLDNYAAACGSYRIAMSEVLEPVLEEIGIKWAEENTSLAQGYVAGKVAEDMLFKIIQDEQELLQKQEVKGTVVLGNIEDDFHSLGRKLVSIFLQSAGWIVHDLGSDVSPEEFVDKAVETGACIIGVSAMMYTTSANIKKVRDELDRRNLSGKIMLAVGGAVFRLRPELTHEVGGDGTAANGYQVPQLFAELLKRSRGETPE
jgi:methylmalonyl-CoA mutase cobalamin-binding domain/chain